MLQMDSFHCWFSTLSFVAARYRILHATSMVSRSSGTTGLVEKDTGSGTVTMVLTVVHLSFHSWCASVQQLARNMGNSQNYGVFESYLVAGWRSYWLARSQESVEMREGAPASVESCGIVVESLWHHCGIVVELYSFLYSLSLHRRG
jgi:hypothetical protein